MKILAPRIPPPGSQTPGSGRLPDELVEEQARRLQLLAQIGAGLWTLGLVLDTVILPSAVGGGLNPRNIVIELATIGTSIVAWGYFRFAKAGPETKSSVGTVYVLSAALAIAALNSWAVAPTNERMARVSWMAILILISSMVMTMSPRRMLSVSLVMATLDPLGVWVAHLRGMPVPSPLHTLALYIPNYACAIVAILPAHVFHRLGRRLREAQDLGSYQLVELLGHGGMGEVWRARHRLLARDAAVKIVRPEVLGARDESTVRVALQRFEREAQATAALQSPHTIRLFDFGTTNEGTFYYVMELLAGRDLESLIREFGPLPADRVVFLLRQVCHSLAEAHARGLVHRDVKPANIYVCRAGLDYDVVKVLDFGLVKLKARADNETLLTADQATTGTPAYMAPEVILGNTEVDRRADVYALGCVAYFMLTGQLVFAGNTPMQILIQHAQSEPVPPSQRAELPIPQQLDDLVMSCLAKDPDKRPQDASSLFRMTCGCQVCDTWTQEKAKRWWESHLSDVAGPLAYIGDAADTLSPAK